MKSRLFLAPALLVGLSVMGFGCNPFASVQERINQKIGETVAEKAMEAATGGKAKVDLNGNGITVTDKETGTTASYGADVKLPAGFPTDVPIYDGAKITVVSNSVSSGAVLAVLINSNDPEGVAKWYDAKFKAEGYTSDTESGVAQTLFKEYKKGDVTMTMALIGPISGDNGESVIQVQISRRAGNQ